MSIRKILPQNRVVIVPAEMLRGDRQTSLSIHSRSEKTQLEDSFSLLLMMRAIVAEDA